MTPSRNRPCPCGSGKKYKKCHGAIPRTTRPPVAPGPTPRKVPPDVLAALARHNMRVQQWERTYGQVRPIVHADFQEHKFVGVGDTIYWAKDWKSFTDFLRHYIKRLLGSEWGNGELAKPPAEQHPIIQWYGSFLRMQERTRATSAPDANGLYTSELDGPSRAYLLVGYELYVLRHHGALQERLIARLKQRDQFQGARYELTVTAAMIRAGFDIDFEDETDTSTRHPEFRATHRVTGEVIAVEAKSRHRPGVLAFPGDQSPLAGFRVGIHSLLHDAFTKPTTLPYLVFVDANMPHEVASPLSIVPWQDEVMRTVAAVEDRLASEQLVYTGTIATAVIVTNDPDHYGREGDWRISRGHLGFRVGSNRPRHPLRNLRLLDEIQMAIKQRHNIPSEFPEDDTAPVAGSG